MEKIISLFLSLLMFLTGCTPVPEQPNEPIGPTLYPQAEVKLLSVDVKKDENILKLIEDSGYTAKEYTTYPTEKYFYPIYINNNSNAEIVYITADAAQTYSDHAFYADLNYGMIQMTTSKNMAGIAADSVAMAPEALPAPGEMFVPGLNTSEYAKVNESSFLSVKTSPLSTFAADVDTASYTNIRSIIRNYLSEGRYYYNEDLHDIRIEEMLNYFNYDYKYSGKDLDNKFIVSTEIGKTPWNEDTQLLVMNLKAYDLPEDAYTGSNLVLLIDTSGSMATPEKFPLMKESLKLLVNELSEKDTVSIVTYSGTFETLLDGANGTEKDKIIKIIDELQAMGATNGEGGINEAYRVAEKYKNNHSNNRIIMCSDGDLNVGISSASELEKLVTNKRESGIYLSILGFGLGNYSDERMETLADKGNGNYYYIDNLKEGKRVLVDDLMSTLMTIADDVKFQVEFNPEYIKGYRKIGYENRDMADEDFSNDKKDGGEVGYGHEVTIVYEIVPVNSSFEINDTGLKYQNNAATSDSKDWLTLSIRYKNPGEKKSNLVEYIVNEDNFKDKNSDDWNFISNVIGFGLVANESEYKNDLTLEDVIAELKILDLTKDEYKAEFKALVEGYKYIADFILE